MEGDTTAAAAIVEVTGVVENAVGNRAAPVQPRNLTADRRMPDRCDCVSHGTLGGCVPLTGTAGGVDGFDATCKPQVQYLIAQADAHLVSAAAAGGHDHWSSGCQEGAGLRPHDAVTSQLVIFLERHDGVERVGTEGAVDAVRHVAELGQTVLKVADGRPGAAGTKEADACARTTGRDARRNRCSQCAT